MFARQNEAAWSFRLPGLAVSRFEFETATSKFDLLISAGLKAGRMICTFEYRTGVFERSTIERSPAISVISWMELRPIRIGGSRARRCLLKKCRARWRRSPMPAAVLPPVHSMVEAQVLRTPDGVALACGDQRVTYGQLNARANQLANYLQRHGVAPETRVAISLDRSVDLIVGLLGILKAGGVYVPLDPSYPGERLSFMLRDCGAQIVLTESSLGNLFQGYAGKVVCVDSIAEFLERYPDTNPTGGVDISNLAYILYTRPTGRPKGVAMTHACLANLLQWHRALRSRTRRTLNFAPAGFDVSFQEFFSTCCPGHDRASHGGVPARPGIADPAIVAASRRTAFRPYVALQQLASPRTDPAASAKSSPQASDSSSPGHSLPVPALGMQPDNQYGPTEAHVVTAVQLSGDPHEWPEVPTIAARYPMPASTC
jgi:non-ribosomal peptide synthetase component F